MISLKNTLKAITSKFTALNTLLNDVPHYTLLWTNPNPSSAFAAQTISLDLSKYDAVEVISYMSMWNNEIQDSMLLEIGGLYGWLLGFDNMEGSNYVRHNKRRFKATKSGVIFETATSKYNTTTQNSDGHCLPYKIYGIKFGGGITSRLCSALGGLYAKLKGYLKGDCGEHILDKDRIGREGNEVYGIRNACDSDNKLVHDSERWNCIRSVRVCPRLYICPSGERRRKQSSRLLLYRANRQLRMVLCHGTRIQRPKSEIGPGRYINRRLCSILSLRLNAKEVFV